MHAGLENTLEIQPGEIHLWMTRPAAIADPELLARYYPLMSAEESQKQQRYRFESHRHDALVTRAFVRDLLSAYAPVAPQKWRFASGVNGKPEIIDPPLPLRFNLSHTRDMIICVVTLDEDIGCDVEQLYRRNNLPAIARTHFSREEQDELFSLPTEQQRSRFFDYWTLKESWIKACGAGVFRVALGDFSFRLPAVGNGRLNGAISLSFAPGIEEDPRRWHSWLLSPGEQHRIAISVKCDEANSADRGALGGNYRFRFFETIPLKTVEERFWG